LLELFKAQHIIPLFKVSDVRVTLCISKADSKPATIARHR